MNKKHIATIPGLALVLAALTIANAQEPPDSKAAIDVPDIRALETGAVSLSVESGTARLSGTVPTLLAKEQIEEAVSRIDGIVYVYNDIRVYAGNRRDLNIRTDIEKALFANPLTESWEVTVSVEEGEATLEGVLESGKEMQAALRLTKSVPGVKRIKNKLVVEVESPLGEGIE